MTDRKNENGSGITVRVGARVRTRLLQAARVGIYILAFVAPVVLVSLIGVRASQAARYALPPVEARTVSSGIRSATISHDWDKPTAIVVLNNHGSQITDSLAPYEVLAESGAFNVYLAAPEPTPVTFSGGVEVIPQLTFAEVDRHLAGRSPDLIMVPAMWDVGSAEQKRVAAWLRRQAGGAATVMSVCDGAEVLADAGLLKGRRATANWANLDKWASRYPDTTWVRGKRYVEDSNVITSAGVTSGINATLRVVSRHLGDAATAQLARRIGYPDQRWGAEPSIAADTRTVSDRALYVVGGAYGWGKPRIGVVVEESTSEIELASAFDTYPGPAFTSRTTSLSRRGPGAPITSKHGLQFVPRYDLESAPDLDRLLVPGRTSAQTIDPEVGDWARQQGLELEFLHASAAQEPPRFPFDATLTDLARRENTPLARYTARLLQYPIGHLNLAGDGWPLGLLLRPVAVGLLGLGLVVLLDRLVLIPALRRRPPPATGESSGARRHVIE